MIISASRRTDIPAFYSSWFMERVRAGFCLVRNPFNPNQISRVSLLPEDVDVIVFWTRYPQPLLRFLPELEMRGYRYFFHYTLVNYPQSIEPHSPPLRRSLDVFKRLSDLIGPGRITWRYDPIFLAKNTDINFHEKTYAFLAGELRGYTFRSIISEVQLYRKVRKRLRLLKPHMGYVDQEDETDAMLFVTMGELARENGMSIYACASGKDLRPFGVLPGRCIDGEYLQNTFGIKVDMRKDSGQRQNCGCIVSKDIGAYNTCLFGCLYCYATDDLQKARSGYRKHDPTAPVLQ